jgi:hypothetical protein
LFEQEPDMPFRKAKSIELHEAHLIITTSEEGYALTNPVARPTQTGRPAFRLRPADLDATAARFGLAPSAPKQENPAESGLPLLQSYSEIPAGEPELTIINLECDVQGPNLVEIRIEARRPDTQPEANDTESITHSGTFTIWWADERPASPEQLIAQAEAHPPISIEAELPAVLGDGEQTSALVEPRPLVEADGEEEG